MDFFGGDFNFVGDGDLVLHTRGGALRLERATARRLQRSWERALHSLIEIATYGYTYHNLANGAYSRIDTVYVRLPPWMVAMLRIQGAASDDPLDLRRRGLRDHAPYVAEVCPRVVLQAASRPIPRTLCQHPQYGQIVADYAASISMHKLPALLAWNMYKVILRAAAESVRRRVLAAPYIGDVPELVTLSSIWRAAAHNDARLAMVLRSSSPAARRHLCLVGHEVRLTHLEEFNDHIRIAKAHYFDELKGGASTQPHKKKGGRLAAAARSSTLWSPVAKRLSIHSIRIDHPDGGHHLIAGREGVAIALYDQWAPTFDEAKVNSTVGAAFLQR